MNHITKFLKHEAAAGIIMMAAAIAAIIMANSGAAPLYENFTATFKPVINDWFMVIFFFVVAIELKTEVTEGVLSGKGQVALPLVAALGGMIFPAIIYSSLNPTALRGWAIPTATDIAFALSVLMVVGRHVSRPAKIFLLAIAIFDDLGAIVIIALFYTSQLHLEYLAAAALCMAVLFALNRRNYTNLWPYIAIGGALAALLHEAGIHTTIGGVIAGIFIPRGAMHRFKQGLHKLTHCSSFIIIPLFAFANAGLVLSASILANLTNHVTLGVALGLFFGKQFGIFTFTWLAVRFGLAAKPEGATWFEIYAIAVIAGIGFTMSLFIDSLAFASPELQEYSKLGIILGSLASALFAAALLKIVKK